MSSRSDLRKEVKKLFVRLSSAETNGDWETWKDVWAEESIFEQLDPNGNIQKRKPFRDMLEDMEKEVYHLLNTGFSRSDLVPKSQKQAEPIFRLAYQEKP